MGSNQARTGLAELRPRLAAHRVLLHGDGTRVLVRVDNRGAMDVRSVDEPLLGLLDGTRSVDELLAVGMATSPPLPPGETLGFLTRLDRVGLLEGEAAGQLASGRRRRRVSLRVPPLAVAVAPGRWLPRAVWPVLVGLGAAALVAVLTVAGVFDLLDPFLSSTNPAERVAILYLHATWLMSARGVLRGLCARSLGYPVGAIEIRWKGGLLYLDGELRARAFMARRERLVLAGVGLATLAWGAVLAGTAQLVDPRAGAQPIACAALYLLALLLAPYARGDGWHLAGILTGLSDLRRRTASFLLRRAVVNVIHRTPILPEERRHLWATTAWLAHGVLALHLIGAHAVPAALDQVVRMATGRGVSWDESRGQVLVGVLLAVLALGGSLVIVGGLVATLAALVRPLWRLRPRASALHVEPVDPKRAQEIEPLLETIPFFSGLGVEARESLLGRMQRVWYEPGDRVIVQGDPADRFCFIRRGTAQVLWADESGLEHLAARFGPGDFFGESALTAGEARSASVVAVDPLELVTLERGEFLAWCESGGAPGVEALAQARSAAVLRHHPLFAELPPGPMRELLAGAELCRHPTGARILEEGAVGDALYVIRAGTCSVWRATDKGEAEVARLAPGDWFGEIALLTGGARTASVRAEGTVELVRVPRAIFARVLLADIRLRLALGERMAERLGQRAPG
jgi:CRP-like cAMP-binding protein